jgi:hypothetical protein
LSLDPSARLEQLVLERPDLIHQRVQVLDNGARSGNAEKVGRPAAPAAAPALGRRTKITLPG